MILAFLDELSSVKPFRFEEPVDFIFAVRNEDYLHVIDGVEGVLVEDGVVRIKAASYLHVYDLFWKCYLKMLFGLR